MSDIDDMMMEAADAASVVKDVDLRTLVGIGQATVNLKMEIDKLEETIKELRTGYTDLRQRVLPEAMAKLGLAKFALEDGTEIKVEEFVGGGLPKDAEGKEKAIEWLIENGAGGLIKTGVSLSFGRDQYDEALSLTADLKARGLPVEMGTGVHPQTLHAFVRERLRAGEPVDQTTLGVFVGRVAKFKGA
jgi:hypothetical protein